MFGFSLLHVLFLSLLFNVLTWIHKHNNNQQMLYVMLAFVFSSSLFLSLKQVTLVKWNEPYQKLASCDSTGIIFVWIKYEGRWSIELINDRNTPVTHFSWSHDGRMALICYQVCTNKTKYKQNNAEKKNSRKTEIQCDRCF